MGIDDLTRRRAVFLDRDGVINHNVLNPATQAWESPLNADEATLIDGALEGMRRLEEAGYLLFVVSNQPNYAKGKASLETLNAIHTKIQQAICQAGIDVREFYYCLHHPDGIEPAYSCVCKCRKPSIHFLLQARDTYSLDLDASWMVGDRETDIECGSRAGVRTVRIVNVEESVSQSTEANFVASNLLAAALVIAGSACN